jgi:calmodulin
MEVDINGDGTIDFQEFLGMMKQKANEADQESDLKDAFKIFDRDKDGYIDMKELKKVANMLGATLSKDEVEEFMREADVVRPGQILSA